MTVTRSVIAGVGTALPPCRLDQQQAFPILRTHYCELLKPRSLAVMEQVLAHPSIETRYIAVDSLERLVDIKNESADERMERFTRWAVSLSAQSARQALERAGVAASEVTALVVHTCTGYLCPGIATYLIEELGLRPDVRAYDLVGCGCGGALPALQIGETALAALGGAALCIAVEICSATFQMGDDMSLLISNAIFGDGAAAVVLVPQSTKGMRISATDSKFLPAFREDVRFVYKNGALHNQLSPQLPEITGTEVAAFIRAFLAKHNLEITDITHWAIHPGGDKILNALQQRLGLPDSAMELSRRILRNHGNMSSPTVLFGLEQIVRNGLLNGERGLLVAFGAGMSMHATLLEPASS